MNSRLIRLIGLLGALALLVVACGDDVASTTEAAVTTAAAGASTTAPPASGTTTTAGAGTSTTTGEAEFAVMPEMTDISLILDFVPGGIHSGIYSALAEGYFEEANLNVDIQPPTSSADTLRLVVADQATIGIAPVADVASLRAQGEDVQIFMALEQVPLGALMSTEAIGVSDPSELADSTIGVTGVPSDEAIARFILESSGVDPATVEFITIGFDAVGNLIGQTVDAAIGFWSAEAVVLELEGETPVVWRADEFGAPPYPELVFFTSESRVAEEGDMLQAFYDAVARGYAFAIDDPDAAVQNLADNADGIDVEFAAAEFANVEPYFLGADGNFGTLEEAAFDEYLQWAIDVGILESMPEGVLTTDFMP
jgi:ABC-type nitrate/sulfonate/bicarbonate transport system substrate-binding protein